MAQNPKNKNVRIGPDGTIYIGEDPQKPGKKTKPPVGSGSRPGGGTGTGSTQQAQAPSGDSDKTTWVIACAIVGAIAFYFASADSTWVGAAIGACAGAACAMFPRVSIGIWIFGFISMVVSGVSDPCYTFFQTYVPGMAAMALFVCMGFLRYNALEHTWEEWVEGLLYLVAAAMLAISVGFFQFSFSTPIIGPAYAQLIAAESSDEEGAEAFAKQYYTNATVDSDEKDKPKSIEGWEERVRACIEPGSPAEKKFNTWVRSSSDHSLGFLSVVDKVWTSSSDRGIVSAHITYRKTQSPDAGKGSMLGSSEYGTVTCTMSENHFVWDYD